MTSDSQGMLLSTKHLAAALLQYHRQVDANDRHAECHDTMQLSLDSISSPKVIRTCHYTKLTQGLLKNHSRKSRYKPLMSYGKKREKGGMGLYMLMFMKSLRVILDSRRIDFLLHPLSAGTQFSTPFIQPI